MMSEEREPTYSPRRIRFLLLHYSALEGDGLAREWALVREDRRPLDCLCSWLNTQPTPAQSYSARLVCGPDDHTASHIRSDLDVAAHALNYSIAFLVDLSWRCLTGFENAITERDRDQQARRRYLLVSASVRMALQLGWRARVEHRDFAEVK